MMYKDLTDEVIEPTDEFRLGSSGEWEPVDIISIGKRASDYTVHKFRRPQKSKERKAEKQ